MKTALTLALGLAACLPAASIVEGRVTDVRDVDTIVVSGVAVRLQGIDGPERGTPEGGAAARFMAQLVWGRSVRCALDGSRTHDREAGICYLHDTDIGALAVATGHALDCPRYSRGRYRHLETQEARLRLRRSAYCGP